LAVANVAELRVVRAAGQPSRTLTLCDNPVADVTPATGQHQSAAIGITMSKSQRNRVQIGAHRVPMSG
jgi:hypothetical protein